MEVNLLIVDLVVVEILFMVMDMDPRVVEEDAVGVMEEEVEEVEVEVEVEVVRLGQERKRAFVWFRWEGVGVMVGNVIGGSERDCKKAQFHPYSPFHIPVTMSFHPLISSNPSFSNRSIKPPIFFNDRTALES